MILDQDFEDFVQLLNLHNVDYMIVGGYALAFHGKPRHTGDLDIWIDVSRDNAKKMMNVLKDFGMSSLGLREGDFLEENAIMQIGYPPLRIDILTAIDGVEFAEAYLNKQVIDIDGIRINYISLNDLILNKQKSGRHQDISDVEALKKLKK